MNVYKYDIRNKRLEDKELTPTKSKMLEVLANNELNRRKTMSNIEEDIVILGAFNLSNIVELITQEEFEDVKKAINNVLADRERLIKENEEFKNGITVKVNVDDIKETIDEIKSNYISKDKIRQKIKKLYYYLQVSEGKVEISKEETVTFDIDIVSTKYNEGNYTYCRVLEREIRVLQELLESEEK